ncbi:Flavodoxin [Raoultella terrigena]|uniref:Flavodoxin n=1 Tax=Raoultella terrigena TaxID=577 RepID=A0A4U9CWD2_RAOTE|nr:Flavodoxin [Raoultella terrigena]
MANIGIFFGTDTGKTRKIAKLIHKQLGGVADAPVNINRTTLEAFLAYPVLILVRRRWETGSCRAWRPDARANRGANLSRPLTASA